MSKALDEYEGRKSCAITTARRLAQFLGDERIKDKGLNCNYVIARRPDNLPTSDRAIPVAIFSTEASVARTYLRKWCGDVAGGMLPDGLHQIVPELPDHVVITTLWHFVLSLVGWLRHVLFFFCLCCVSVLE